jgi:hypothetical protein
MYRVIKFSQSGEQGATFWFCRPTFDQAYDACQPADPTYWHIKMKHGVRSDLAAKKRSLVSYNDASDPSNEQIKFYIEETDEPARAAVEIT